MGWTHLTENKRLDFRATYGGDKLKTSQDEPLHKRVPSPTLYEPNMRHQRCEELLHKALAEQGTITPSHMMAILRDHYSTYRLPSGKLADLKQIPFYASTYGATEQREEIYKYPDGDTQTVPLYVRSICVHGIKTSTTACSGVMIAQEQKTATMLYSVGTPCIGIFVPFFPLQTKVESPYATAALSHTAIAINLLMIGYYEHFAPLVQQLLRPPENKMLTELDTLSDGTPVSQLTVFSQSQAKQAYELTEKAHKDLQRKLERIFANRHS